MRLNRRRGCKGRRGGGGCGRDGGTRGNPILPHKKGVCGGGVKKRRRAIFLHMMVCGRAVVCLFVERETHTGKRLREGEGHKKEKRKGLHKGRR